MRKLLSIICLVWAVALQAQQLVVSNFTTADRDMDARVNHPVKDQNGKTCALIKVENPNKGFDFNTGTLQVQKVDASQPGETWVYVMPGVRKITIRHNDLGILRDYQFPVPIEEATVYIMKLQSGKVETIVTPKEQELGFLIIESNPKDAQVWIDGEWLGNTPFRKKYPIGTKLDYSIKKTKYHDEVGKVTVDQMQTRLNPTLQPAFGKLVVTTTPAGATIYIDDSDAPAGISPLTIDQLASGKHTVRAMMPMYGTSQKEITISDGVTANIDLQLAARFAEITVNSLPGAKIEINGSNVGLGNAKSRQSEGVVEIKASLAGHHDAMHQINVVAGQDQTITLKPTPIYGKASIDSEPFGAQIYIDGKSYGTTPAIIGNLLVGSHALLLKSPGYDDYSISLTITEGKTQDLLANLVKEQPKPIAENKSANNQAATSNSGGAAKGVYNGHDYVDLGLPSGLKWATCNLGANAPHEYGDYYCWGETEPATNTDRTSKTYDKSLLWLLDQGYIDSTKDKNLTRKYDAASQKWGGSWRIPTAAEWTEMLENTTHTLTTVNGINGYKLTSKKNGKSIFIPFAGYRVLGGVNCKGLFTQCWSATRSDNRFARQIFGNEKNIYHTASTEEVYRGNSIRPVSY